VAAFLTGDFLLSATTATIRLLSTTGSVSIGGLRARGTHRLVSLLLDAALERLPEPSRLRWAEEWAEHRTHHRGGRLIWWALCLRATAARTGHESRHTPPSVR
jgi:hypothetical protein